MFKSLMVAFMLAAGAVSMAVNVNAEDATPSKEVRLMLPGYSYDFNTEGAVNSNERIGAEVDFQRDQFGCGDIVQSVNGQRYTDISGKSAYEAGYGVRYEVPLKNDFRTSAGVVVNAAKYSEEDLTLEPLARTTLGWKNVTLYAQGRPKYDGRPERLDLGVDLTLARW